ncbi:MAG TPA: diadenylate cyclase CdaA [Bacteroidales bacterium]|nr:diadenylate cyclase CdaA [Bacteroidales bacterium]
MIDLFIKLRFFDVVDILLVSYLMYQFYILIRGTVAINIFIAIFIIYIIWLVVKALNMELLTSIMNQVVGVGMIALIIVFQQEIRRFLVYMGSRYLSKSISLNKVFTLALDENKTVNTAPIVEACMRMSESGTGALIVIARKSALEVFIQTGDLVNAETSARLLETIFFKNSPLHDGAAIIIRDKIHAARCVLPVSDNPNLPPNFGMRHRAALGITENTDALAIIVSEESHEISVADAGVLTHSLTKEDLSLILEREFTGSGSYM